MNGTVKGPHQKAAPPQRCALSANVSMYPMVQVRACVHVCVWVH